MKNDSLTLLNRLPPSKASIHHHADEYVFDILDGGEKDPLQLRKEAAIVREYADRVLANDDLRDACIREIEKYDVKSSDLSLFGVKFAVKETGVKYDYSQCGDPILSDLYAEQENLKKRIKEREKLLQTLPPQGMEAIDDTTGEIYRMYPPARSSTTSVTVTIPK